MIEVVPHRHAFGGTTAPLYVGKAHFRERRANREAREALSRLFAEEFAETVNVWRRGIDLEGIGQVVGFGADVGVGINAVGIERMEGRLGAQLLNRINEAVLEGGELGLRFSPPQLAGVPPELVSELAASYIETSSLSALELITAGTRSGVQRALLDQLAGDLTPTRAAAQIGDLVGLNPQQVRRMAAFRADIEASLIPGGVGETDAVRNVIETRVRNESQRLLRERGRLIADTEMQAALQEGERGFWQVAHEEGAVNLDDVIKTWMTVDDGRVCPVCMPMHGKELREGESFELRRLGRFVIGPPAHPRCRCYLIWEIVGASLAA